MNFFNRAWKYITRKVSKSILLGLTFFIVGNLVLICLGVMSAADNAKKIVESSMNPVVATQIDYQLMSEELSGISDYEEYLKNMPFVTQDLLSSTLNDERVEAINAFVIRISNAKNIKPVPLGNKREKEMEENTASSPIKVGATTFQEPNIMIKGNAVDSMIELKNGTVTISEGRFYTKNEISQAAKVAVINKELAELNNLRLGDSIDIYTQTYSWGLEGSETTATEQKFDSFEIIGIYETKEVIDQQSERFDWMSAYESPKNVLYMPSTTVAEQNYKEMLQNNPELGDFDPENAQYAPTTMTVLLKETKHVDQFMLENQSKLPKYMNFDANKKVLEESAKPMNSLASLSSIVFVVVVVNAIVIISLVIALTLKTREFEIGILLSTGASKIKIIAQLFLEMFIITVIGFTLAVGTGVMLAGTVGDIILDNYLNAQEETEIGATDGPIVYYGLEGNYFTEVSQEDLIAQYQVKVDIWIIIQIYTLGTLLVFLSILIPGFMVMRLNPKQILLG